MQDNIFISYSRSDNINDLVSSNPTNVHIYMMGYEVFGEIITGELDMLPEDAL